MKEKARVIKPPNMPISKLSSVRSIYIPAYTVAIWE
jgi:hypothetical protein